MANASDDIWETDDEDGELDELQQELFDHLLEHDPASSDQESIASLIELDVSIENRNEFNAPSRTGSSAVGCNFRLYNALRNTRLESHQALRPSWRRDVSFLPDNPALVSPVYNVNFEPNGKVLTRTLPLLCISDSRLILACPGLLCPSHPWHCQQHQQAGFSD